MPQTQWKKREGFYSQASKDLQTRVFHFKKGRGNTGSLRRGCGLGQVTPGSCLPAQTSAWSRRTAGDWRQREERLPQGSHLTLKGRGR